MTFLRTTIVASFLLSLVAAAPAYAVTTQWWTNRTSSLNIFDAGPFGPNIGERPRLGAATSGYIEGTVVLPSLEDWVVQFSVSYDGNQGSDVTDFVRVYLGGAIIGDFTNDMVFPISHSFSGTELDYRFEFTSSNSIIGFHQIVNAGTISVAAIPIPATLPLFAIGLSMLGLFRRRNLKQCGGS